MFSMATPAKQNAEDTIITLSSRLSSATLLEDRRAAVLGLKSFASSYPATVSSNALRGLIGCLDRDGQDVDTSLATLQTLLQLFDPNEDSPEASEDIALWLADEFTQQQDKITLLLDFLDSHDFYTKLCSLKLITSILSSRPERTIECICTAPLGISRLVTVLDDNRNAIRNEGLSLLIYLTPNSTELQKTVAFEDVYDRIFNIIEEEGSLLYGGRIVEDCLILLSNLLRLNESNQILFRETGFVPKISLLLSGAIHEQENELEIAEWARTQKNRNEFALLAVLRLFLVTGGKGTEANQASFWQYGILGQALELAFSRSTASQIMAEALVTCADIIRGNSILQENFSQLQVKSVTKGLPTEKGEIEHQSKTYDVFVIDGLLELILSVSILTAFDSRIAACECIKAYLSNHHVIRGHFLQHAIARHGKGVDVTPNFLTILLEPLNFQTISDPYRFWFASVIFFNLVFDDPNSKKLAMSIYEGDASNGEEVVTCLQSLAGNLLDGVRKGTDLRILVGYLMLLCGWLFEDPDGVNDFLGEGSLFQSLVQALLEKSTDSPILQGLCAMLLGILYEFSTKDSPVPRSTIFEILTSQLGRDKYIDKLSNLRSHYLLRDFEILPQKLSSTPTGGLPEVFFDRLFVEFTKDNFSRMLRSLDRDPQFETPLTLNGVQKGISRELVDCLRSQLEEKTKLHDRCQESLKLLEMKYAQEQNDFRRTKQNDDTELSKIKQINETLQKHHEEEIEYEAKHFCPSILILRSKLHKEHNLVSQDYQQRVEQLAKTAQNDAVQTQNRMKTEVDNLKATIRKLEVAYGQAVTKSEGLQVACDKYELDIKNSTLQLQNLERKVVELETANGIAIEKATVFERSLKEKENEKQAIQNELDDLLMVFADMEDKVTRYKQKLKTLGEIVSDEEDDVDGLTDENSNH